jgi:hypothetical protein
VSATLGTAVLGIAISLWNFSERLVVYQVAIAGIAPIVASVIAIRNPRLAGKIAVSVGVLIILFAIRLVPLLKSIVVGTATAAILLPGIFWLATSRTNWLTPRSRRPLRNTIPLAMVVVVVFLCSVYVSASLFSLSLPWWPLNGDCGGTSLLDEMAQPRGIDFTARVLFVPPRFLALRFYDQALWAIAHVEKRFSEPSSISNTVILRGHFKSSDESQRYFVEGTRHNRTLLSHFLPVVEPVWCGHTKRLELAQFELRILAGLPHTSAARIIGRVYTGYGANTIGVVGARVLVEGPQAQHRDILLNTDGDGIFESAELAPGVYTVQLFNADDPSNRFSEEYRYRFTLNKGQVAEAEFVSR